MKQRITEAPAERACARPDCEAPGIKPISEFYARGFSVEGFRIYDHVCKKCTCKRMAANWAKKPKGPAKPRGGHQERMKPLELRDILACTHCGLRGHAANDNDGGVYRCPKRQPLETGIGGWGKDWAL